LGTGYLRRARSSIFIKGYDASANDCAVISEKLNYVDIPVLIDLNIFLFLKCIWVRRLPFYSSRKLMNWMQYENSTDGD